MFRTRALLLVTLVAAPMVSAAAQNTPNGTRFQTGEDGAGYVPPLAPLLAPRGTESELRDIVARYVADGNALGRRWNVEWSPSRRQRFREFYRGWQTRLRELDFDKLAQQGRIDYVL